MKDKEKRKEDKRRSEFSYLYKGIYITVAQDEEDLLYYAYYQKPGEDSRNVPGMPGMQTSTSAGIYARKHLDSLGL